MLASIIPGWKYVSAGVGILVLGLVAWWVLDSYVITPSDVHDEEEIAIEAVCEDLQSQFLKHLNEADRRHLKIGIVRIPEDTSNQQYRRTLAKLLPDSNKRITVDDGSLLDKVKADGMSLVGSDDEALTAEALFNEKPELNAVLVFERPQPTSTATEVQLKMKANLIEKVTDADGNASYPETEFESYQRVSFETQEVLSEGEEGQAAADTGFWSILGKSIVGIIAALGIPFLWLPLTDPVTKMGNNAVGLSYLGIVAVSAMIPYFLMVGFGSGGEIAFGVLLFIICAIWTYRMHDAWSERVGI